MPQPARIYGYFHDPDVCATIRVLAAEGKIRVHTCYCPICEVEQEFIKPQQTRKLAWLARIRVNADNRFCTVCGFEHIPRAIKDKALRASVFAADDSECVYCAVKLEGAERTIDHVTPLALGGLDVLENLVTACRPCNTRKRDRTDITPVYGRFRSQP